MQGRPRTEPILNSLPRKSNNSILSDLRDRQWAIPSNGKVSLQYLYDGFNDLALKGKYEINFRHSAAYGTLKGGKTTQDRKDEAITDFITTACFQKNYQEDPEDAIRFLMRHWNDDISDLFLTALNATLILPPELAVKATRTTTLWYEHGEWHAEVLMSDLLIGNLSTQLRNRSRPLSADTHIPGVIRSTFVLTPNAAGFTLKDYHASTAFLEKACQRHEIIVDEKKRRLLNDEYLLDDAVCAFRNTRAFLSQQSKGNLPLSPAEELIDAVMALKSKAHLGKPSFTKLIEIVTESNNMLNYGATKEQIKDYERRAALLTRESWGVKIGRAMLAVAGIVLVLVAAATLITSVGLSAPYSVPMAALGVGLLFADVAHYGYRQKKLEPEKKLHAGMLRLLGHVTPGGKPTGPAPTPDPKLKRQVDDVREKKKAMLETVHQVARTLGS